ncbi:MAG TPA: hypothetical protein VJ836_07825 [Candidatus Saccharimonadales bacterium]|nr:hypothetical protein [Candidatus Saccharimonadales bacterium]
MSSSASFLEQCNHNLRLLDAAASPIVLPEFGTTFNDQHGTTRLEIKDMRLNRSLLVPVFDLTYIHADPGQKLSAQPSLIQCAYLPAIFSYDADPAGRPETCVYHLGDIAVININPEELTARKGLFNLAHQIGHTFQKPYVKSTLEYVTAFDPRNAEKPELYPYAPAVETLWDYAEDNREFAQDCRHTTLPITAMSGSELTYLEDRHPPAVVALNALAEAIAWRKAISLVNQDVLHPGLSYQEMQAIALQVAETYDTKYDSQLHVTTLMYALEYQP